MQARGARWRRWVAPLGIGVAGLVAGSAFSAAAQGARGNTRRPDEDFSVQVTRIENPETEFFRTNITSGTAEATNPDLFFYKVRDNKNGRILYFMYYQGAMQATLYTQGD